MIYKEKEKIMYMVLSVVLVNYVRKAYLRTLLKK